MKSSLSFVVAGYVIGTFMALSAIMAISPLHITPFEELKWDKTHFIVTIIPLILGGATFYLFSERNLAVSHLKWRKICGAIIVVFYTTMAAYPFIYFYLDHGPKHADLIETYFKYATGLAATVLPGTLGAAVAFVFPKKKKAE